MKLGHREERLFLRGSRSVFVHTSVFHVCLFEQSSCVTQSTHVPGLINASLAMVNGLLALCDFPAPDPHMNADSRRRKLRMSHMARYDMTAHDSTPHRYTHLWHRHPQ